VRDGGRPCWCARAAASAQGGAGSLLTPPAESWVPQCPLCFEGAWCGRQASG
jgi:hypothetical protein